VFVLINLKMFLIFFFFFSTIIVHYYITILEKFKRGVRSALERKQFSF